ncbi:4Fe-4S dicluster domain-containing protein [Desulfurivibrio dismutans]|uniref:4Fe-4S dicluster domain-containing protein n=1 Tax=Desulfurivibrio dismutans TaxID=1398908 RepID=UPI0023DC2C63|nr:4Fe-4S dicluster domain-containing protein [Desulfurivibrio alkaliphilus]
MAKKKSYRQHIFYDWCKACGLCVAFCPKQVYRRNEEGQPVVADAAKCVGCRFCELHCPDFAITISAVDAPSRSAAAHTAQTSIEEAADER